MTHRDKCLAVGFDVDAFMRTPRSTSYDNEEPTSLYVIACGEYVKIGIANDIKRRIAYFQSGNPYPIKLVRRAQFTSRLDALLVERTIHKVLSDDRHFGEWFVCGVERAREVVAVVVPAHRALKAMWRKDDLAAERARRERYQNDPEYRAQVDWEIEDARRRWDRIKAREAAKDAAAAAFDQATPS